MGHAGVSGPPILARVDTSVRPVLDTETGPSSVVRPELNVEVSVALMEGTGDVPSVSRTLASLSKGGLVTPTSSIL